MKTIIQRNLPLTQKYVLIDKKYIPLVDGYGCTCDDCGALIANIATVRGEDKRAYNVGFDCLEKLLINNGLLSGRDIDEFNRVKKMIPKIIRFSKTIKETKSKFNVTGLLFETHLYKSDYYPFYWLQNNNLTSRDNDYIKLKDVDFEFLIETLKNIFPKLDILTK